MAQPSPSACDSPARDKHRLIIRIDVRDPHLRSADEFAEAIERCVVDRLRDPNLGLPSVSMPITDIVGNHVGNYRLVNR